MNAIFNKHKLTIVGTLLGFAAGYIYWYYWGCVDGCTIRSVWWRMSLWGALMGGLLFSMVQDRISTKQNNSQQ